MTEKKFDKLKKDTIRHWEKDVLNFDWTNADESPISMETCPCCKMFLPEFGGKGGCSACMLHERVTDGAYESCLEEVVDLHDVFDYCAFPRNNKKLTQMAKQAYKEIMRRFDEYEKKNFSKRGQSNESVREVV